MNDVRIVVDGQVVDAIDPADRGLAYGDGLFETMRIHEAKVPWWDAHWARLAHGAQRLAIELPDESRIESIRDELIAHTKTGVLKLLLTRGVGGRGYAPPQYAQPTVIFSLHPLPSPPTQALRLRWCETRLAIQPLLAGIKHCNRLEQIIARSEWNDPEVDEGLLRDSEDNVVSAISANLFVLCGGTWITPPVDRCGVAGICRDWLLAHAQVEQRSLSASEVEAADLLFLCNSVRGILPVASLGTRCWQTHPQVTRLQNLLSDCGAGFAASQLPSSGDHV